jgi:DNA-binding NarL/FixJ family response regulator
MLNEPLTRRERDVLEQVTQGHTNRQIAQTLSIGVGTVKAMWSILSPS